MKENIFIEGDLVLHNTNVCKIECKTLTCDANLREFYNIRTPNGCLYGCIRPIEVTPIPLTPEILEKNGWEKVVMNRGVKNSHWVYTKPDIEEYGYFPIYIEKGIGDEFDVYPFTGNHVCTQIAYIKYVHQLQHLLFGLGLNSEMEV